MACFICKGKNLLAFLDLGKQSPSDAFLKAEDLLKKEERYPLQLAVCESCFLVQLTYVVDPEKLFRDYVYNSAANNSLKANFKSLVNLLVSRFHLQRGDWAVDIGSNDGTLLSYYQPYGLNVLGIDPSSATALAVQNNIPTLVDFFSSKLAEHILKKQGPAKIITATNVFAHIVDIHDTVAGIAKLLSADGVFVSESGYLLDLITKLQFDSIYHEHLRYYSLKPLQRLFSDHGLEIFDVERITTHGGSIRVYAGLKSGHPISSNVQKLIILEERAGLYTIPIFTEFAKKVEAIKKDLNDLIVSLKKQGNHIAGIGAPAKGNTLLNYCNLTTDYIDYLVEKSQLKIGLFAPGTRIPVVSEDRLFTDQPEYALMLSWNIADELIPLLRNKGYRGKFIMPTPVPKII